MKIVKLIVIGTLTIIGVAILAIIIALATLLAYLYIQYFLFGRGDYLLFVSSELNTIPILMIITLIIYNLIRVIEKYILKKEKQTEIIEDMEEPIDIKEPSEFEKLIFKLFSEKRLTKLEELDNTISKMFKVVKICYIPVLILIIYCGMTSYAILYSDSIKISSPIAPTGMVYQYDDIKSIDVGVEKEKKNYYTPYYKIIFNNDKSVNLFGGSMHEDKGKAFEYILIDLDKELRNQGVSKRVNKVNFELYAKDLNKEFISRVEQLFDNN